MPTRRLARWWTLLTSELALLLMTGVAILGVWGFAAITDEVLEGETQSFDETVMRALRRGDDPADAWGPPWLETAAVEVTVLGGTTTFSLLTLAVAGYLLLRGLYPRTGLVVLATGGGAVLVLLMKTWFARPRPDVVPHLTSVHTMSFPSGHAAMSAMIYLTLAVLLAQSTPQRRLKTYFMVVAIVLTLLIGSSRVYLGVHYPTDVLAGWCVGVAWAALVWLLGYAVHRASPRERAEEAEEQRR